MFLCGLLPADQDNNYGADANNSVKKWMKLYTGSDESKQTLLHGQVSNRHPQTNFCYCLVNLFIGIQAWILGI